MPKRKKTVAHPTIPEPHQCNVDELFFDPANARLAVSESLDDQLEILRVLWRDFAVDEIALSIEANGFFQYEPLFAAKEKGQLVVIEGNRRLAAVKLLRDPDLRRRVGATDLPHLAQSKIDDLDSLPAIVCSRDDVWQHLGFKHINGPQAWGSEAKAKYIEWVHRSLGISLDEIAKTIGDTHLTVQRLFRAYAILEQAEEADVWKRDDRYKSHFAFSHLYTGLTYNGFQEFIGLRGDDKPVPSTRLAKLGELLIWLFGSKSRDLPPLVRSQNPDLRHLDEALKTERGVTALRRGMPLAISLEISRGDEKVFRESVQVGKQSLQKAIGLVLTGYQGDVDLFATATEITELAEKLLEDMGELVTKKRARRLHAKKK